MIVENGFCVRADSLLGKIQLEVPVRLPVWRGKIIIERLMQCIPCEIPALPKQDVQMMQHDVFQSIASMIRCISLAVEHELDACGNKHPVFRARNKERECWNFIRKFFRGKNFQLADADNLAGSDVFYFFHLVNSFANGLGLPFAWLKNKSLEKAAYPCKKTYRNACSLYYTIGEVSSNCIKFFNAPKGAVCRQICGHHGLQGSQFFEMQVISCARGGGRTLTPRALDPKSSVSAISPLSRGTCRTHKKTCIFSFYNDFKI